MKIVAISDTHNKHEKIVVPKGDVLIHAGDFSSHGTASELWTFLKWFAKLPHKHKLFIAGNHDRYLENLPPVGVNDVIKKNLGPDTGITYLLDTSIVIEGKKFFGAPWQPDFCNWAFQAPRGKSMAAKWHKIPQDTNVLITHGPAYGNCDYVPKNSRHTGCLELLKRIVEIEPDYHICGHIHEAYGRSRSEEVKVTKFINASCCDGKYSPTNKAQRIEYNV